MGRQICVSVFAKGVFGNGERFVCGGDFDFVLNRST